MARLALILAFLGALSGCGVEAPLTVAAAPAGARFYSATALGTCLPADPASGQQTEWGFVALSNPAGAPTVYLQRIVVTASGVTEISGGYSLPAGGQGVTSTMRGRELVALGGKLSTASALGGSATSGIPGPDQAWIYIQGQATAGLQGIVTIEPPGGPIPVPPGGVVAVTAGEGAQTLDIIATFFWRED